MYNLEHATIVAADVLRRCDEKFQKSVDTRELLHFEITDRDLDVFAKLYPKIRTANERVRTFLNFVILRQLKMPYELTAMLADASGHQFTCRAKRALPDFEH